MRLSATQFAGRHRAALPCSGVAGRKLAPLRAVAVATSTEVWASFHVTSAPTKLGQVLKVVGSAPELGSWNIAGAPKMEWKDGDWVLDLAPAPDAPFEFKVVVVNSDNDADAIWEKGNNRQVQAVTGKKGMRLMCQFDNPSSMVLEPLEVDTPELEPAPAPSASHTAHTQASPAEKPQPTAQPSLKVLPPSTPKQPTPPAAALTRASSAPVPAPASAPAPAAAPAVPRTTSSGSAKEPAVMEFNGGVLTVLPYPDE